MVPALMFNNVRDLTRFLAVAERGNILAAAEHLGLTQPALSYTITRVERRFGAALFERHSQGVRLTALGAAASERGQRVLREIEAGEADLAALRKGRGGTVAVAASAVFLQALLPGAIAAFHKEFPRVEVVLQPSSGDVLRLLAAGCIDLYCGVIGSGRLPPGLRCKTLPATTAGIVAHRRHPLHGRTPGWADLAGYPWIEYGSAPGDAGSSLVDEIHRRTGRPVEGLITAGAAGLSLLQAGDYLARLPLAFLDRLPGRFLEPLPGGLGTQQVRAGVVSRHSGLSLPAGRLHEILCQAATQAFDGEDTVVRLTVRLAHDVSQRLERCAGLRDVPVTKKHWILLAIFAQLEEEESTNGDPAGMRSAEDRGRALLSHTAPEPARGRQVKFSLRMPGSVSRRIERAVARRTGPVTRQQWIEQAILEHLAREERVVAEGP